MAYSLQMLSAIRGKVVKRPSLTRRAWQYAAGWKLASRERRFWYAQLRGQRRAEEVIAKIPELGTPRDIRKLAQDAAKRLGIEVPDCSHVLCETDKKQLLQNLRTLPLLNAT
jgi:hypothetical protein